MPIPQSTLEHKEHSILEELEYDVHTDKGVIGMPVSYTDGSLGVDVVGDKAYVTAYSQANDTHFRLKGMEFDTEADAREAIVRHQKAVRSHIVIEEDAPPSQAELLQQAENRKRREEENKRRTSGGIFLDGDNW